MKKRMVEFLTLALVVLLVLAGLTGSRPAYSAPAVGDFPNRQITFVCPYDPGGGVDASMRIVAAFMQEKLGQQILVENIPGAGSIIGWNTVQQRPSDGYTITSATGTANPWIVNAADPNALAWDPDAFTVLCKLAGVPASHGLIINSNSKWTTLEEFVTDLRNSPPKTYNIGIMGPNQLTDPVLMDFEHVFGVDRKLNVIYFATSNEIQTDLLTGDCDIGIISCNRDTFVHNENFRVLTLFGNYVPDDYPVKGIPLISETQESLGWKWSDQKFFTIEQGGSYYMIKSDTPQEIKDFWLQSFKELSEDEEFKKALLATSYVHFLGPDEARAVFDLTVEAMEYYMDAVAASK